MSPERDDSEKRSGMVKIFETNKNTRLEKKEKMRIGIEF